MIELDGCPSEHVRVVLCVARDRLVLTEDSFVTVLVIEYEVLLDSMVCVNCDVIVTDCESSPVHDAAEAEEDTSRVGDGAVAVNETAWDSESVVLIETESEGSPDNVGVLDHDDVGDMECSVTDMKREFESLKEKDEVLTVADRAGEADTELECPCVKLLLDEGTAVEESEVVEDTDNVALLRDPVRLVVGVPIEIVGVGMELVIVFDAAIEMVCVEDNDGLLVPGVAVMSLLGVCVRVDVGVGIGGTEAVGVVEVVVVGVTEAVWVPVLMAAVGDSVRYVTDC